ncbi:MAG: hypothetical protein U5O16_25295 [Rhodococcus sp. (in: high G+C Gram-positive bacteria)]|uniref:hypothetical protein n=1 Tax=Rhodococcus sp. TaxID=1831 RepID=UPI002AD8378B|nr:hypothetical protein [Rhodococcus sp. (in: high G+C Gram-positive bacteria)]
MKVIEWCADRRRVGLNIVCKNVAEGDDFTKSDPRQGGEWGAHDREHWHSRISILRHRSTYTSARNKAAETRSDRLFSMAAGDAELT